MGAYISKPQRKTTEAEQTSRKRPPPHDANGLLSTTVAPERETKKPKLSHTPLPRPAPVSTPSPSPSAVLSSKPTEKTSQYRFADDIDATPDDKVYRYVINCEAIWWMTKKELVKVLNKLPKHLPPYTGLTKVVKNDRFFISFPNEACAQRGQQILSEHVYKKQKWIVEKSTQQPLKRQRFDAAIAEQQRQNDITSTTNEEERNEENEDGISSIEKHNIPCAGDVTAQWRDVPYEIQLQRKSKKLEQALRDVTKKIRNEFTHIDSLKWLTKLIGNRSGDQKQKRRQPMCCPLELMISAEDVKGTRYHYRNKNEFTIGYAPDLRNSMVIGYNLGLMREGKFYVGAVDERCKSTGELGIDIAKALTPVIRDSGLKAYDRISHKGYWRQLVVRESVQTGQALVVVSVNVQPSDGCSLDGKMNEGDTNEEQESDEEKLRNADLKCRQAVVDSLKSLFATRQPKVKEAGIFWQPCTDISFSIDTPIEHLYGLGMMEETLHINHNVPLITRTLTNKEKSNTNNSNDTNTNLSDDKNNNQNSGLKFRIQPASFFQVNTSMTERLYQLIGEAANINKNTVVLDVCCGTGSIGLSLARIAHSVVGIEMNEAAVLDARHNASLNSITNATFIAGRVEQCIHDAIKLVTPGKNCVVVLDPPRAGVSNNVIGAIRGMAGVQRVVYVSCEAKNFWKNAMAFCRPTSKTFKLEPFFPRIAYGVDLFPHTPHVEMVVVMDRVNDDEDEDEDEDEGKKETEINGLKYVDGTVDKATEMVMETGVEMELDNKQDAKPDIPKN